MIKRYFCLILAILILAGCAPKKSIERIDADEMTDVSGYWNDTDSRLVSDEMIKDCIERAWLQKFQSENNRKPVVIVGYVANKSMEHISTETFIKDIERYFINSNIITVVANSIERDGVKTEKYSQQDFASSETAKKIKEELGADFMMIGGINMIVDEDNSTQVRYYQINLELVNIETNEKVWIGEKKIKKVIE